MNKAGEIFQKLFSEYPILLSCRQDIEKAFEILLSCAETDSLIMCCGNGGSAADSEHIIGELMKGFKLKRPLNKSDREKFASVDAGEAIAGKLQKAIRAVSLTSQQSLISAIANDVDAALVFAQQVFAYAGGEHDVLIALSTSGNSPNVLNAAKTAKAAGIKSIAITGEKKSGLYDICCCTIRLPSCETYKVQELSLPLYHALCAALEAELFDE